jgi:hypothetical protein
MPDPRLVPLQDLLAEAFDTEELDDLSTRLGVDYEELAGRTKTAKARSLLKYLDRRKRLDELIRTGREQRPELDWPAAPTPAASPQPATPPSDPGLTPDRVHPPVAPATPPTPPTPTPEIYISYPWGEPWEGIVDELDRHFQAMGISIIRDRRNLGYKGRIKEFMAEIGRASCIIVVISDKYLKSENCMFELLEIASHGALHQRIFPLVLEDADIYKAVNRLQYVKYWESRIAELDAAMKDVGSADLQGIRDDIDLYTRIRAAIAGLTDTIKDMNTLTPEMHRGTHFEALYQAIEATIEQDRQ